MGFGEIRANKSREDKAVDDLTKRLTELGGCKFLFPPIALYKGLKDLLNGQLADAEEACKRENQPLDKFVPQDEEERTDYLHDLTRCAWEHFQEHAPGKINGALAELIQESLYFAQAKRAQLLGADEEVLNQHRPSRADLEQNVLRRSILRLKNLPYRKREGVDGVEDFQHVLPTARAVFEIYNSQAHWAYDHTKVAYLLRDEIRRLVATHKDPDGEASFFANEAAEFIWDNINGGMQTMALIIVEYSLLLAKASAAQRLREQVTEEEFSEEEFRKAQITASKLEEIAKEYALKQWFENMSVKLSRRGRPPKGAVTRQQEAEQSKAQLVTLGVAINQIEDSWSQSEAVLTLDTLLRELQRRNLRFSKRTLIRRLNLLGMDLRSIRARIEKKRAK